MLINEQIKYSRTKEKNWKSELLMKHFSVLDHGYIKLIDVMGSDRDIVQAARISYGKDTKKLRDDEKLIRHLMRNNHTSPFEQCELKFSIKVPMDCWRQWIRHRMASINEYSTRYSEAIEDKQRTNYDEWRKQNKNNKQGSDNYLDDSIGMILSSQEIKFHEQCNEIYNFRISAGVAREQARKDLPLSTYTKSIWKIDLHNLLHFLKLRMDSHAQYEIRQYANVIGNEIVAKLFPMTWKAFMDYQVNAITFSSNECKLLSHVIKLIPWKFDISKFSNLIFNTKKYFDIDLSKREMEELFKKLEKT